MSSDNHTIAILTAWNLSRFDGKVYIPSTHLVYLKYAASCYRKVYLLSPIHDVVERGIGEILLIDNLELVPLPYCGSYIKSLLCFRHYYMALRGIIREVDYVYCRVPGPYAWMPRLLFRKKTIMHFVGDTIDATKNNEQWGWLKKTFMIAGYYPDYLLNIWASRYSCVYTNGMHLARRLSKYHIKSTSVISSTVSSIQLPLSFTQLPISKDCVYLTYIGYIRYAKGMNCLIDLCEKLHKQRVSFRFNIIGDGEMLSETKTRIHSNGLNDCVFFYGHIDDRNSLNAILRQSDLFFFPSLSEGSPRVVIEAMSQGVPVISTPVGSLPSTFIEGESIRFFDFNDSDKAMDLILQYVHDPTPFIKQREIAFSMVKERFTVEKFLSIVFQYHE